MIDWMLLIFTLLCALVTSLACWFMLRMHRTGNGVQHDLISGLPDAVFILNKYQMIIDFNDTATKLANSSNLIGQPITQMLTHMPAVGMHCHAKITTRFETTCNTSEFGFYETTIKPLFDRHGQTTGQLLTLRDITAQHLEQMRQQVLVKTGELLSSSPSAELPLRNVAQLVAEHHLVDICAIYLKNADGTISIYGASSHSDIAFPFEGEEAMNVMRAWQPVLDGSRIILSEVNHDKLFMDTPARVMHVSQLRSVICMPLQSHEHIYGALLLATMNGSRTLNTHDTAVAESLAQQMAIAIKNHRMFAALQEFRIPLPRGKYRSRTHLNC